MKNMRKKSNKSLVSYSKSMFETNKQTSCCLFRKHLLRYNKRKEEEKILKNFINFYLVSLAETDFMPEENTFLQWRS